MRNYQFPNRKGGKRTFSGRKLIIQVYESIREVIMSTEYGFSFAGDRCIQCYGCEVACKSWRGTQPGVRWRRVSNVWHGSYPDVKNASLSVACMHCVDPECLKACPEEAITKRSTDGIVLVDREKCTGCRICLDACHFGAPQFGDDGKMQKCDMCTNDVDLNKELPPCAGTCPTEALKLVRMESTRKIAAERDLQNLFETLPK
jgi:anaerobic dimethyl sulfoxide reductase subunit B